MPALTRLLAILALTPLLASCVGPGYSAQRAALQAEARKGPVRPPIPAVYKQNCEKLMAEFKTQLDANTYLRPPLVVHSWPGKPDTTPEPGKRARTELKEEHFTAGLRRAAPRLTLMMARGGVGKSKLGWAIEAQTCDALPVLRVDLQWDVAERAPSPGGINPVLAVVAERLGVQGEADVAAAVERHLRGQRFLLLLDSLDEVAMAQRDEVVRQAEAFFQPYPEASVVVFTRPPVFSANYGFSKVDARIEIPMFDCARADAAIDALTRDPAKRQALDAFIERFGLKRKVEEGGLCWYPQISTFRDLKVLQALSESAAAAGSDAAALASRAKVHEFYLTAQLLKDLSGVQALPKDLVGLIDRMVAARGDDSGRRDRGYTIGACLAQLPGDDIEARKATCERLMQSSAFQGSNRGATWSFSNPTIADLFLARWIDGQLAGDDGRSACGGVPSRSDLFESGEVAGFLVGLPHGQKCLLALARELCKKGSSADHSFEMLDQGLPGGVQRAASIENALSGAGEMLGADTCEAQVLRRLKATVPAPVAAPAEPEKAPDPAPKKSTKKGRKGKKK